jgi:hypothetical protein
MDIFLYALRVWVNEGGLSKGPSRLNVINAELLLALAFAHMRS